MKFITMIIRAFYDYNYCKNKFEKKYEKAHNSTVLLEFRLIEITTMSSRYIYFLVRAIYTLKPIYQKNVLKVEITGA